METTLILLNISEEARRKPWFAVWVLHSRICDVGIHITKK